jgi:diguanylate cyclase (GGDEF)-like protein
MASGQSKARESAETLADSLYDLLYRSEPAELDAGLERLECEHGEPVYAELVYLLSHLRFDPAAAREHWQAIVDHRADLQQRLGTAVDLRVALVSYFVQVNLKLENPKVIELKLFEQTQASAYRDGLTGLHNYRSFGESLERDLERSQRNGEPLSLVMIDVDDFKHYNDTNGHEAGIEVLATIGRLLSEALRGTDEAARYGGEEFALILPGTTKKGALRVAERARVAIARHEFPHGAGQPGGRLTVSAGVATHPADAADADQLVQRADQAMYVAKSRGKNQTQLFELSRRSHKRFPVGLEGGFKALSHVERPLHTVELSEAGLSFTTRRELPVGAMIELYLNLPVPHERVDLGARVVRVRPGDDGEYELGVRLLDRASAEWDRLARFVRDSLRDAD